jgi:hypothetical protein
MRRLPVLVRLLAAALLGGAVLAGCGQIPNTPPATNQVGTAVQLAPSVPATSVPALVAVPTTQVAPAAPVQQAPPAPPVQQAPPAADCGGDYYINSSGNCVHRPEQAPAAPAGATARCNDGAYSFSQHRRGTCSGHGGVAQWLVQLSS